MDNMKNCASCSREKEMSPICPREREMQHTRPREREMHHDVCPRENERCPAYPGDNCSNYDCNRWEIGMGYVPLQKMGEVYEPAQALRTGTLFPELEKPFMARPMARRGARR